jgi:hypothetical protein
MLLNPTKVIKLSSKELKQYANSITETCILKVTKEEKIGIIFYRAGKVINGRINNEYGKDKAEDILTWENTYPEKIIVSDVAKFNSENLAYMFDFIELLGISADIYVKYEHKIFAFLFSEGALISVIPEINVTRELIVDLFKIKDQNIRMKLTGEKIGEFKIFISELLSE